MEARNCARRAQFAAALRAAMLFSGLGVCAASTATADVVRILDDNRDALAARAEMIARARHTIDVSLFCIGCDEVALAHLADLRDAARRSVKVRIVVDAFNSRIPRDVQRHLLDEGLEIKEFHPLRHVSPRFATCRLHDKLLIVDGRELITGGRNIESRYFGLDEQNFVDRDVYVCGQAAAESRQYFDELWNSSRVYSVERTMPLGGLLLNEDARTTRLLAPRPASEGERALDLARSNESVASEIRLRSLSANDTSICQIPRVRFLCDPCGDKSLEGAISEELVSLIDASRQSILIDTPYLVLSPAFASALVSARQRAVRVRITTNSLASTNKILAQAGYAAQKQQMLDLGIELWEFNGPEIFHPKSFLIDDRVCVIGSFNLDPRSELRDTQTAIVAEDWKLAALLRQSMDRHLENARLVAATSTEGSPTEAPEVAPARRAAFIFSRLVAPLVRDEL